MTQPIPRDSIYRRRVFDARQEAGLATGCIMGDELHEPRDRSLLRLLQWQRNEMPGHKPHLQSSLRRMTSLTICHPRKRVLSGPLTQSL
jgi:hypothetical protein